MMIASSYLCMSDPSNPGVTSHQRRQNKKYYMIDLTPFSIDHIVHHNDVKIPPDFFS